MWFTPYESSMPMPWEPYFNMHYFCPPWYLLTQNLHPTPSTQQAEQASFTREEITRRASQFSLKINKKTK
jgi:hypothetical protein